MPAVSCRLHRIFGGPLPIRAGRSAQSPGLPPSSTTSSNRERRTNATPAPSHMVDGSPDANSDSAVAPSPYILPSWPSTSD